MNSVEIEVLREGGPPGDLLPGLGEVPSQVPSRTTEDVSQSSLTLPTVRVRDWEREKGGGVRGVSVGSRHSPQGGERGEGEGVGDVRGRVDIDGVSVGPDTPHSEGGDWERERG